ncbi:MAG: isocitrate lyase/phosphoenolpyruvate mutase family protein [Actinomycetota bacterium]|nr:isocitrate lyase/phosphoenolpyruvate mutase family protein [Actinomycetota bacterium]
MTQSEKAEAFRALHEGEPFLFPNPWDVDSARALAGLGFKALASTSAGLAERFGRSDGEVTLAEAVDHARELDEATDLPVAMDLENGYGPDPAAAAEAVRSVGEAGAVGGSIEDWDPADEVIYCLEHAVARIEAAVKAARGLPFPFTLTARAENQLRGLNDLDDTITRLKAFEKAGADVLYAPGLRSHEKISAVCGAVSKPVNVLALPGLTLEGIAAAGGQRISLGSWLWSVASGSDLANAMEVAASIRNEGDFSVLASQA